MKMSQKLTLLAALMVPAVSAAAEPSFYAIATGGYGLMDTLDVDTGRAKFTGAAYGSLGLGVYATDNIRFQSEVFYFQNAVDEFEIDTITIPTETSGGTLTGFGMTFNAQYEFLAQAKLRPFIGFGAGFVSMEIDRSRVTTPVVSVDFPSDDATDFVLQTDFGLNYYPIKNISISPAYRFLSIGGTSEDILSSDMHLFTLSGAFHF